MRILITNDDGVFAPGIAALARGLPRPSETSTSWSWSPH